jgi:biotin-dependent carboxylase-like uncharacterized protein
MSFIGKIKVGTPGLFTTIQDEGRFGYRKFGVPPCGVMDDYAAQLANFLVGNDDFAPLLEISFTGPRLTFFNLTEIAITGADISPVLNGRQVKLYETIKVQKGDQLSFGKPETGCRAYLAISGGFIGDYELNSCSTYVPVALGGNHGKPLASGDTLFFNLKNSSGLKKLPEEYIPKYDANRNIRIIKGPEWMAVSDELEEAFSKKTFTVSKDSNRMGIRLEGKLIDKYVSKEMLSSALAKGSIQLIPSGQLIIAMSDGQTTGGYPRVASISSVDLSYLSQLKTGDQIKFKLISLKGAKSLFLRRKDKLGLLKK